MKRPEGFDKAPPPADPKQRAGRAARTPRAPVEPSKRDRAPRTPDAASPEAARPAKAAGASKPARPPRSPRPRAAGRPPKDTGRRDARRAAAEARREARRAAAERRRYEKAEIRRFTRRQRTRRIAIWTTVGTVGLVVVLVLVAILSPILSLRTVLVEGTSRVDASAVQAKVEAQLGTPLALIDYGRIDADLREFPVIRSYTTETIPPGTIVLHITERQPVVGVASASGDFVYVDPAGVTVQTSKERLPGVPLVIESGTSLPNPAFDAAVEVLQAMPAELRGQIDTITATTRDDVWLTFAGVPQAVKWGSADDSLTKVRLLEILRANFGGTPGTFDVSATSNGIFRPA